VPLLGAVEYVSSMESAGQEPRATVALLQGYVPNQGDGWGYTLNYLERFLEDRRSVSDIHLDENEHGAYRTLMETLATRTAELHRAFAMRSGDRAFEPEPFTAEDFQAWKEQVRAEAEQTVAMLSDLPFTKEMVFKKIENLKPPAKPALKTRHHGDYHLGQVLIASNDFFIIDFEGEPHRPLEDGRRKHTPARDLAGMLRSFSYAKWSALKRVGDAEAPTLQRLSALLDDWEAGTRHAFVKAYGEAVAGSGIYGSLDDAQGLLELAEIEKVLYELRYELANRPDWVRIPMEGLISLLKNG
jgi:maltose alpha-D-glucosyltransferase/alpha-amylase